MGIKNLLKFLSSYPDLIKKKQIDEYYGKKIAVDISILIYQIVIAIRNSGSDLTNDKGEITSHILGIFNKTINFLDNGIIPVYVFDGKPPSIKNKILNIRKQIRTKSLIKLQDAKTDIDKIKYFKRSVLISRDHINQCKELLFLMGIPYINAPEEADSELSYLCKNNLVYAVLSEDMDILTFGSPKIIRNLTSKKKDLIEIDLNNILNTLHLTHEQFIELCILFGCDYCEHITDVKIIDIYNVYSNNKTIEGTLKDLKTIKNNIPDKINYLDAKQYFIDSVHNNNISEDYLKLRKPDIDKLTDILVNRYGLIKYQVIYKLNKLNNYYNKFKNL